MQVPKEEIRSRIINAALDEFSLHGYKKVSMKNIAREAGITAGNIYAYFPSKEALLEYLLNDAVSALKEIIHGKVPLGNPRSKTNIDVYSRKMAEEYMQIRKPFLILIKGCEGSNFENVKSSLIALACHEITIEFPDKFQTNPNVAEAVAVALINGVIHIFVQCDHDFELLSSTLTEYIKFMFGNLFKESMDYCC